MPRFVLEIGTEEIPPRYFPVALPHLAEAGKAMLDRARLAPGEGDERQLEVQVYGTPRRLVLIAENMAAVQAPAVREERGPSAKVAFDSQGKPTKAAEGFARRWGITPDKLERRQTDATSRSGEAPSLRSTSQGEYVFAIIQESELPAAQALAPLLPGLITGIPFPKTMRWGSGALRFGRPIRWLLALVDDQVVEFELEGIKSGRLTRGHPVLAEGMYEVADAAAYESVLEGHKVMVEPSKRQSHLDGQLRAIARSQNATAVDLISFLPAPSQSDFLRWNQEEIALTMATSLFMQATFLVECPTAAVGAFDERFLALPREVLVTEMKHVQGYFPLEDARANLLPRFIAVRDGGEEHLDQVVAGWESVLRAKLIDASYFYEQDLKTPLAERVEALKGVVFQEKLGTVYEKMERVRAIAGDIARQVGLNEQQRDLLGRAAYLCKADLTTEMVTELPDLQGVMGREYAKASGEAPEVANAIREHYLPRFPGDTTPTSLVASALAIADKLDTVVACFAVGIVPSGSADPYGLRREASGIVSIVLHERLRLSLRQLVNTCWDLLLKQSQDARPSREVTAEVIRFLRQRLDSHPELAGRPFGEPRVRYDLMLAAFGVGGDDLLGIAERTWALESLRYGPHFLPTVIATTRVINIIKGFEGGPVDEKLLTEKGEPAEKALWQAYQDALAKADQCNLMELFMLLKDMRPTIDRFFDEVLVMHEDEKIRRNRLALCWSINQHLFRRLADFSLIVQT